MRIATQAALGFPLPPHRLPYESMQLEGGVGLIGLHWVVQCLYLPAYRAARYRVRRAAEIDGLRVEQAVSKGFPRERITQHWQEIVDDPEVQVVDCCFGHRRDGLERRLAVIEACAQAGKALLIQKPVAQSLEVANRMAAIANEAGVHLTVNQNGRFNPATMTIKGLLTPERLGPPSILELRQYWTHRACMPSPSERPATIDHTIHHTDLLRWWAGAECTRVYARSRSEATLAIYEFANGAVAYHHENHAGVRAHENEIRVMTERGTIRAGHNWDWSRPDAPRHDFVHLYLGGEQEPLDFPLPKHLTEPVWHELNPWEKEPSGPFYDLAAPVAGFMGTLGTLLHAKASGEAPANPIATAIDALRMALAAQLSSREGKPVDPRELPANFRADG